MNDKGDSHQIWARCSRSGAVRGSFAGPGPAARPHGCPEVEPFGRLRHPGIVSIGPAPIHARPNNGQLAFGLRPVHVLDPQIPVLVGWAGHRPGGERNRAGRRRLAQARPRPCFRAGDEIGPQRVAFYIADDGMEVVRRLEIGNDLKRPW